MTAIVFAQPDTLWTRTFGGSYYDTGASVQQTTDGGYIIAGTANGPFVPDPWLIKTDYNGDTLWTRIYMEGRESASSVQQTSDGGYIIAGTTTSPLLPPVGSVLLIKTDSNGDTLWTRTFGEGDRSEGASVQQTTDGGYIIAGTCELYSVAPCGNLYLVKTDSDGESMWTRSFGRYDGNWGRSVQQTTDGGYIVTGSTCSYGAGSSDVWLIKTNSDGDTLWTRTFGGSENDGGNCVQQTTDGGYIVTGSTSSYGAGGSDVWLIKTDSEGNTLWTRTFGGIENDGGNCVQQTTDGGYIVTGSTSSYGAGGSDVWLIKTDSIGDSLWSCTIGGSGDDGGSSVQQTTDEGYIITGSTYSYGAGMFDVWLIRFDSETPVEIETELRLPGEFRLYHNYPNPFNPVTTIRYDLPKGDNVSLFVYDVMGREIVKLVDGYKAVGTYNITFNAKDLVSGVYFVRLTIDDGQSMVQKIVLMK